MVDIVSLESYRGLDEDIDQMIDIMRLIRKDDPAYIIGKMVCILTIKTYIEHTDKIMMINDMSDTEENELEMCEDSLQDISMFLSDETLEEESIPEVLDSSEFTEVLDYGKIDNSEISSTSTLNIGNHHIDLY